MAKLVRTAANNLGIAAVAGDLQGFTGIHKFGQNASIDTNTDPEDVWSYGGLYDSHFMSSAATLYVSSDAAGDTSISVEVQYLDSNWDVQVVTKATDASDGRTFVSLGVLGIRVFRAKVVGGTAPTGTIYISDSNTDAGGDGIPDDTDAIKATIAIGDNQTLMAVYTIPNGYTGYLKRWRAKMVSVVASSSAIVSIRSRPSGGVFLVKDRDIVSLNAEGGNVLEIPEVFAAKTDVVLRVDSVTNNATNITGGFDIVLIQDATASR